MALVLLLVFFVRLAYWVTNEHKQAVTLLYIIAVPWRLFSLTKTRLTLTSLFNPIDEQGELGALSSPSAHEKFSGAL